MSQVRRLFGSLCLLGLIGVFWLAPSVALAQIQAPDDEFLFQEDSEDQQKRFSKDRENMMRAESGPADEIDFSAPTVDFDSDANMLSGSGGVIISGQGFRVQGQKGQVDLDTKDLKIEGDVLITGPESVISADKADFNLDTEVGEFENSKFTLEEGAYRLESKHALKLNDVDFELKDCLLSTCHCPDGTTPWDIKATDIDLTREGYAHTYNSKVRLWGTPVLYTPWLAFPVKQERASGLLVPEFGYGSEDGLLLRLPTFLVLDDSSDMTITPFTESKTRHGMQLDYRRAFSERSSVDGRMVYSDERPRDGELRGTDISNLDDPGIDDDRFGGYLEQNWANRPSSDVPLSVVSDIHYVSDNLFLREMEDSDIGLSSDRYTTSRVALRAGFSDYVSSSVVGEYNQSLISPQDTTLQRLPEVTVNAQKSYRPFGFNPYGLKVTPALEVKSVNFKRDEGYDGQRYDFGPSVKIPFHYKNYFNSELKAQLNETFYSLDDITDPDGGTDLDDSSDRELWRFSYKVGTIVERVYSLPSENFLTTLTSLGSRNQTHSLERVKHTLEPNVTYAYTPGTEQDDLPFFDSFDRSRQRSLVTYELMSRLLGSFGYRQGAAGDIEEFTESASDFTPLDTLSPLTDFDAGSGLGSDKFGTPMQSVRRENREIRELVKFRVVQSYDYVEDKKDDDPNREAFSDVGTQVYLTPTRDFGFGFGTNYDAEDSNVSSWNLATHLYDDRGDRLRARYSYVEEEVSQLEGNIEIPLSSRLRLGYYARFDELESELIEQQAALRISSACDCWHFDVGFSDEINPDRERVLFKVTLRGLGDIAQNFGFDDRGEGGN